MRETLLTLLRCPACGGEGALRVVPQQQDQIEIVSGVIECQQCNQTFSIRDGYCNLLHEASTQVRSEQEANARIEARGQDDGTSWFPQDPAAQQATVAQLPHGYPEAEAHAPAVAAVLDRLNVGQETRLLDLGAGLCWTSAMAARRGAQCIATDVYVNALASTRYYWPTGIFFERLLADMTALPIVSGAMDVVLANAAVHHSGDLESTVREAARVLKPGGCCVLVNEPVIGWFEQQRKRRFGEAARKDGVNERIYRVNEWRKAFRKAGLHCRLEMSNVGLAEKILLRKESSPSVFWRFAAGLAGVSLLPYIVVRLLRPFLLNIYPFNVIIWGWKPEEQNA